ncbi:ABC transporter permease [Streptomyces sp. NPDC057580]|uniref:ABC transporter permease n=1 Tax=Streptomyces sp. NPDC057580 TaxID=3346173 RepID=UPI00367A0758
MTRFLLARLGGLALTLLVTSFLVFCMVHVAPGDPASFLTKGRSVSPEAMDAIRAQYHLDDPFFEQYVRWLSGVVQGDFGRSVQHRQEVSSLLAARLPGTFYLVLYTLLLSVTAGTLLGLAGALRRGVVDTVLMVVTTVAAALPAFVAGIVLIGLLSVTLGWFPVFGDGSGFWDRVWHLTLPAIALGMSYVGLLSRVTRSTVLEEVRREHVEVARSRGLAESRVIRRHVLRNALPPVIAMTGLLAAGLFVLTSVVEVAFGLSGIGSLLIQSVTTKDFPVVQAVCLLVVFVFVVANTLVDVVGSVLDPRVRLGRGAGRKA